MSWQLTVAWTEVDAGHFPHYFRGGRPCVPADRVPDDRWTRHQHTLDADLALDRYEAAQQRQRRGDLVRDLTLTEAAPPLRRQQPADNN